MPMSETPIIKRVTMDEETHRRLEVLADAEHRTLSGQVEFLIDKELRVKGIDPDTLQPVRSDDQPTDAS